MSESNDQQELTNYLKNPELRHLYVDSSMKQLLAMQLRSMREARGWSGDELGEKTGMKQSAIARLEDPEYGSMTLSTLKRMAKVFDVALTVRFAPFSEFISWTTQLDEKRLSPPSFDEEIKGIDTFNWFHANASTKKPETLDVSDLQNLYDAPNIPTTANSIKETLHA